MFNGGNINHPAQFGVEKINKNSLDEENRQLGIFFIKTSQRVNNYLSYTFGFRRGCKVGFDQLDPFPQLKEEKETY